MNGTTQRLRDGVVSAAELLSLGLALCRPDPGQKKPTYRGWPTRSLKADNFGANDLYGILGGPLSDCNQPGHVYALLSPLPPVSPVWRRWRAARCPAGSCRDRRNSRH